MGVLTGDEEGFVGTSAREIPASAWTPDPWAHRSAKMKCATCMWFVPKQVTEHPAQPPHVGRCRRHAPVMSGYPVVFETDWCGDHKLDETKG